MPGFFITESKGPAVPAGEWSRAAVLASLTNSALTTLGLATVSSRVAPRAMSAVALALSGSIVGAGANLTATLFVNGSATSLVATLVAGQSTAVGTGSVAIPAGATYDVRITTPAGWTSVTLDLVATLSVG